MQILGFYKRMASTTMENESTKNGGNVDVEKQLKERAEKNRQKALLLKKLKVVTHPYTRYVKYIYIYITFKEKLLSQIAKLFFLFNNQLFENFKVTFLVLKIY